ncbi:hypothetical protein [Amycolatopsis sp. Hca4]|uniref:hypothetical protein n=1 Tax=Amycolatopsis sp. Hca4 TaxID=2742131 RepID=UPI0015904AD6|nr:hypothetical protein [Amycolatopsis sp. Hca4]QKV75288.1 hypothetical protein HUT10_17060 [Amycolatopsis sp. Hca4]
MQNASERSTRMSFSSDDVLAELRKLRKGRGVAGPGVAADTGPALRELCKISNEDQPATVREKLRGTLNALTDDFPPDLREIARISLAIEIPQDSTGQFLRDRTRWLATRSAVDDRTIRRRLDDALLLLAQKATWSSGSGHARAEQTDAWTVRRFQALLRLDQPTPESFERRTIVALRDGLDQIRSSITIPTPQGEPVLERSVDLITRVHFGAELVARRLLHGSRFVFDLRIPPLSTGDEHEYELVNVIPDGQEMRSHYVFFPERPCNEFDLRIRFKSTAPPVQVHVVREVFHRDVDFPGAAAEPISVDAVHEVHVRFENLKAGFGYGLQWAPAQ